MKSPFILLLTGLALNAIAQNSSPSQQHDSAPFHQLFIAAALDSNKDGIIDSAEQANAVAALKALDQNGNGQLEMSEVLPGLAHGRQQPPSPPAHSRHPVPPASDSGAASVEAPPPHSGDEQGSVPPPPPPVPAIITALDANHDGVIDTAELANAPAVLKTLDRNGDGQLTPEEYQPQRQARSGRVLRHENGGPRLREHRAVERHPAPSAEE